MIRALLAFVMVSLAAGSAYAAEPSAIVGIWYGRGQPHDEREDYIDEFRADGTFLSIFRKYANCEVQWEFPETGRWRLEGRTLITDVEKIGENAATVTQHYAVEFSSAHELHLRHIGTNYLFKTRRQNSYRFPICEPGA